MTKFVFKSIDEEATTTVEFETDVWISAFPQFLNLMKATGFTISDRAALYSPGLSEAVHGDEEYLLFDSDLVENQDDAKCCGKCSTPKANNDHSSW